MLVLYCYFCRSQHFIEFFTYYPTLMLMDPFSIRVGALWGRLGPYMSSFLCGGVC